MLSERQQEIYFRKLLSKDCNTKCADCKTKGATWASLGFGVFVCITCSGVHRSFGMHITRVRSTKLDSWTKEDAKLLEIIGNRTANLYWEGNIKNGQNSEGNYSDFIRRKYDQKLYIRKNCEDPVSYVEKRHFDVKSTSLKNYYSTKELKRPFKNQVKKNKFNLKINKNQKKTQQEDVDFLFMDDNNNKKVQNKNIDDLLFLDLNPTKKVNNFSTQKKTTNTTNNFDFDLIGNKNNKVMKKETAKDDFFIDLSSDINELNRHHSSNLEKTHHNHNMNIFNIQNMNIYNNNLSHPNHNNLSHPNNNYHGKKNKHNSDKYSAFDYFRHY